MRRNFPRSRLYSVILLPLLFALTGAGSGGVGDPVERMFEDVLDERELELQLDLPVERHGVFHGSIVDQRTSSPMAGVEIALPELDLRTVTTKEGTFVLEGLTPRARPYEVLISKPGYKSSFGDVIIPKGGRVQRDFRLLPVGW